MKTSLNPPSSEWNTFFIFIAAALSGAFLTYTDFKIDHEDTARRQAEYCASPMHSETLCFKGEK